MVALRKSIPPRIYPQRPSPGAEIASSMGRTAGALECGSSNYRFSRFTAGTDQPSKAVAGATALQAFTEEDVTSIRR